MSDAAFDRSNERDEVLDQETERAIVEMVAAEDDEPVEAEATVVRARDVDRVDAIDLLNDEDETDAGEGWSAPPQIDAGEHADAYARILALARQRGALGITPDEVAEAFSVSPLSVAPRITELKTFGHLVPNGLRRVTRAGSSAHVLVAAIAQNAPNEERQVPIAAVLPPIYWRCSSCTTEIEIPAGGRAPSWCGSCKTIGSLFALPEDYEPEARAEAKSRHRPFAAPFASGFGAIPPAPAPGPPANFSSSFSSSIAPIPRGRPQQKATIVDPCEVEREPLIRSPSGVTGLDHVMGGGIAQGFVVMIAGPPGAGKSTIATEALSGLAIRGTHFGAGCAYGSAEEDSDAVIETADRVAIANFKIVLATSCQALIRGLDETGAVVWVVDSLMAITSDGVDGEPGMPSQINACSTLLYQRAHAMPGTQFEGMEKRSIYLVAHGTKDGNMAGPMKALHSVDGGVLMEHVDPTGADTKGNQPWAPAKDQTRPTGFISARVYRKMRKASNRPIAYFIMQPEYLDVACTIRNPVGGRLDRVRGPEAA